MQASTCVRQARTRTCPGDRPDHAVPEQARRAHCQPPPPTANVTTTAATAAAGTAAGTATVTATVTAAAAAAEMHIRKSGRMPLLSICVTCGVWISVHGEFIMKTLASVSPIVRGGPEGCCPGRRSR
jgi:hypothetical protein